VTATTRSAYGTPDNGDPVNILDAMGAATVLTRDIYGNVTQLTRSGTQNGYTASVTRNFYYDTRQRLCRRHAPEQGDELFAYDALDRPTARAEGQGSGTACTAPPSGSAVTTGYDALDRPVSTVYPTGTDSIARTYYDDGAVHTVARGGSVWTYQYDPVLKVPTQESLAIDSRNYTYTYAYDTAGSLSTTTDPSGTVFAFAPDGFGRPTKAGVGGTDHIGSVAYHPNGLVAGATFANGQVLTETLTARQLVQEIKVAKSGTSAMDLTYGYGDPRRVVTSIADAVNTGSNRAFTYDADGRLLTASGPWGSGGYAYDALDNLRQTVLGSRTIAAAYDPTTNRVTSVNDTVLGNHSYSYDAKGNTASDGLRTFTHDAADQPVSVTQGGNSAGFVYDGNLKRVKQTEGEAVMQATLMPR
jgi:YD repeat-containing protein